MNAEEKNDSPSPLLHVQIKDASELDGIVHGMRGVRVAVVGLGFAGDERAMLHALQMHHPDVGIVIFDKPKSRDADLESMLRIEGKERLLIVDDEPIIPKLTELPSVQCAKPAEERSEKPWQVRGPSKPWKTKHHRRSRKKGRR